MRLADDERARVPFALVGVVLLVTSAGLAATLSQREPVEVDSRVAETRHEATATARTALVTAAEAALRAAARRPLLAPANTSYGRVLNESDAFREGLRVRLYDRFRAALAGIGATRGGVRATVSLPPVGSPADLRAATNRVTVSGNDSRVRVRVRNVTVMVRRGGRVVERATYTPSVTVRSPVLGLRERVARYERLVNTNGVASGMGRRLTARLYALAWTRGYAQYAGGPVANVLGSRHLALAANGAALGVQRSVFGRSDPRAGRAHRWATAAVVRADLFGAAADRVGAWPGAVLSAARGDRSAVPASPTERARRLANAETRFGVNRSADAAFRALVTGETLVGVLDEVYAAEVWLANRTRVRRTVEPADDPPAGAELLNVTRHNASRRVRVTDSTPVASSGHALTSYGWRAHTVEYTTRRWRADAGVVETTRVENVTRRVTVSVVGRHAGSSHAPRRDIAGPHEPGGPLDGANFAGVAARAVERLVAERGGPAALYRRARNGTLNATRVGLNVSRPTGLREWVYRDVAALRERVRNLSVAVEHGQLRDVTPAAMLHARLRERRDALLDAPTRYDSVASKARVAARAAYLARVADRLAARKATGVRATDRLASALDAADAPDANASALLGAGRPALAETSVSAVRGSPAYLTTAAVEPSDAPGVTSRTRPLVTRNRNLFAVPYGEAAGRVADAVVDRGSGETGLRAAALVLRGANRTLAARANATLSANRSVLRESVAATNRRVVTEAVLALDAAGHADPVAAVQTGLARWDTVHGRALAAANGSLADAVARVVGGNGTTADRSATALRVALDRAVTGTTVPRSAVAATAEPLRALAREAVAAGTERALRGAGAAVGRRLGRAIVATPAGLPVAPVPGFWYATANVWKVQVRGQYQRFAVSAPAGSPAPAPNVTYVREAATVALDVDDDGERERLGRNRPLAFATNTSVVVVVPPGNTGVGDVDGVRDERSAGWPHPGPTAPASLRAASEPGVCCTRRSTTPRR